MPDSCADSSPDFRGEFTNAVAHVLQQTDLLGEVDLVALLSFAAHFERIPLREGERLFDQGDEGDGWYIILSGVVAIVREDDEFPSQVLDHLEPPESFGEMALIDGAPRMAAADAVSPTVLARLPKSTFDALLDQGHPLAIRLLRAMSGVMCRRHRQLSWLLSDLVSYDDADISDFPLPPALEGLLRTSITWN